jgi:hypothetical protein
LSRQSRRGCPPRRTGDLTSRRDAKRNRARKLNTSRWECERLLFKNGAELTPHSGIKLYLFVVD